MSLRSICRLDGLPSLSSVMAWLHAHEDFEALYVTARELQADVWVDEIPDIADDGSNDWMERKDREGAMIGWRENGEAAKRSQIRIAARQWMAEKLRPKKYLPAMKLQHTGKDDGPIEVSDGVMAARLAAIMAAAQRRKDGGETGEG